MLIYVLLAISLFSELIGKILSLFHFEAASLNHLGLNNFIITITGFILGNIVLLHHGTLIVLWLSNVILFFLNVETLSFCLDHFQLHVLLHGL